MHQAVLPVLRYCVCTILMYTLYNRFYKLVVEKVFSSDANDCVPLISEPVDDPMFLVSNL
jgi:hypothetical protein